MALEMESYSPSARGKNLWEDDNYGISGPSSPPQTTKTQAPQWAKQTGPLHQPPITSSPIRQFQQDMRSTERQPNENKLYNKGDDDDDDDDDAIDLEKVKQDAANDAVAMGIFAALGFFIVLFSSTMVMVILLVSKYGVVAWVSVSSLCFLLCGGGFLTYKYISKEKKMRKAHKNILYWKEVAVQVVLNEIEAFQIEMNEHLMITDGEDEYDTEDNFNDYQPMHAESRNPSFTQEKGDDNFRQNPSSSSSKDSKKTKKKKSVLFGMIKPFLSKKKKDNTSKRSRNGSASSAEFV